MCTQVHDLHHPIRADCMETIRLHQSYMSAYACTVGREILGTVMMYIGMDRVRPQVRHSYIFPRQSDHRLDLLKHPTRRSAPLCLVHDSSHYRRSCLCSNYMV